MNVYNYSNKIRINFIIINYLVLTKMKQKTKFLDTSEILPQLDQKPDIPPRPQD